MVKVSLPVTPGSQAQAGLARDAIDERIRVGARRPEGPADRQSVVTSTQHRLAEIEVRGGIAAAFGLGLH